MVLINLMIAIHSGMSGDPLFSDTLCTESGSHRYYEKAHASYRDSVDLFAASARAYDRNCKTNRNTETTNECAKVLPRLHKEYEGMISILDSLKLMTRTCLDYYHPNRSNLKINNDLPIQFSFVAEDRFGNGASVLLDYNGVLKYRIWDRYTGAKPAPLKFEHMQVLLNDSLRYSILSLIKTFGIVNLPAYRSSLGSDKRQLPYRGHSLITIKQRSNETSIDVRGYFPNDMQPFENALEALLQGMPYEIIENSDYIYKLCNNGSLPAQLCYDDTDPYVRWIKNKNLLPQ